MKGNSIKTDYRNLASMKDFCNNIMHPNYKMPPRGQPVYNDNPKTPCERVMKNVTMPVGAKTEYYWRTKVMSYMIVIPWLYYCHRLLIWALICSVLFTGP